MLRVFCFIVSRQTSVACSLTKTRDVVAALQDEFVFAVPLEIAKMIGKLHFEHGLLGLLGVGGPTVKLSLVAEF